MGVIRMSLKFESFSGRVEFEGPEEVVGFFEVGSAGGDFVDQILNADDSLLGELSFNDAVVSQGDSLTVDLSESSLVEKVSDGLGGGVTISNVWLNLSDHVDGGLVESHEDTVVELSQSEELHDLLALGVQFVDTIRKSEYVWYSMMRAKPLFGNLPDILINISIEIRRQT